MKMDSLGDALKSIVDKIFDFFSVLDLSFFLSGASIFMACALFLSDLGLSGNLDEPSALHVLLGVMFSYLLGLVAFSAGRQLRRHFMGPWCPPTNRPGARTRTKKPLGVALHDSMLRHGLGTDPRFRNYFPGTKGGATVEKELDEQQQRRFGELYARLWAELRSRQDMSESHRLLLSYWVRTAIYDGMLIVVPIWALAAWLHLTLASADWTVSLANLAHGWKWILPLLPMAVLALAFCATQAKKTDLYQLEEIVATFALDRDEQRAKKLRSARAVSRLALETSMLPMIHALVNNRLGGGWEAVLRAAQEALQDRDGPGGLDGAPDTQDNSQGSPTPGPASPAESTAPPPAAPRVHALCGAALYGVLRNKAVAALWDWLGSRTDDTPEALDAHGASAALRAVESALEGSPTDADILLAASEPLLAMEIRRVQGVPRH